MTTSTNRADGQVERSSWLQDPASDFRFGNGAPTLVSSRQWLFVMAMVVVGFLALASPMPWPSGVFWPLVSAVLMPGIALVVLVYVEPGHWKAIFDKVGGREVKLMFGFALPIIVISLNVDAIVLALASATPNANTAMLVANDCHAIASVRAVAPLLHLDAFHQAFRTQPGAPMWRAPEQRVRIS